MYILHLHVLAHIGLVYYPTASLLKDYLTERYGEPESETSLTAYKGKAGILFAQYTGEKDGHIGLWQSSKLYGASFTKRGSEYFLWETVPGTIPHLIFTKFMCTSTMSC